MHDVTHSRKSSQVNSNRVSQFHPVIKQEVLHTLFSDTGVTPAPPSCSQQQTTTTNNNSTADNNKPGATTTKHKLINGRWPCLCYLASSATRPIVITAPWSRSTDPVRLQCTGACRLSSCMSELFGQTRRRTCRVGGRVQLGLQHCVTGRVCTCVPLKFICGSSDSGAEWVGPSREYCSLDPVPAGLSDARHHNRPLRANTQHEFGAVHVPGPCAVTAQWCGRVGRWLPLLHVPNPLLFHMWLFSPQWCIRRTPVQHWSRSKQPNGCCQWAKLNQSC